MRATLILAEGARVSRAYLGSTMAVSLVAAVVCLLVFVTAGRSAATTAQVLASIDDAGARLITVTATGGTGLDHGVAARLSSATGVAWAVGLGAVRDVRNTALEGGQPVAARSVHGTLPGDAVHLVGGRMPGPGQALVPSHVLSQLGLAGVHGAVGDGSVSASVVGVVEGRGPGGRVADYVLTDGWLTPEGKPVPVDADPVTLVLVMANTSVDVPGLVPAIRALVGVSDPAAVSIETSDALVTVREVVSGDFGALSRHLALGAVGAGIVVIALVMVVSVNSRRRDFGRRRALGATRSMLLILVLLQAAMPASIGAVVGTVVGAAVVRGLTDLFPSAELLVAVPLLVVLGAAVGAAPAALAAAWRDPVSILRVP